MSVEEVIADRLAANAGVSALVGTRVYQLKLPMVPGLPAVRVQLIDEVTSYHFRGEEGLTRARVQVDSYGKEVGPTDPYATVSAVADAVHTALSGAVFTLSGRRVVAIFRIDRDVLYEGAELRLLRIRQDFTVISGAA